MTVDFPIRAGEGVAVVVAPATNGFVGGFECGIRAEVRGGRDVAGGGSGGDDLAVASERGLEFDADFEVDLAVEIDGYVSAGAGNLLIAQRLPDEAAGFGDDSWKLAREAADDGDGAAGVMLEADLVGWGHTR